MPRGVYIRTKKIARTPEEKLNLLTNNLQYDILNLLVEEADFLCQNAPLVCVEKQTVSPTNRRTRGFLLEENMTTIEYNKRYYKTHPWAKTLCRILSRCNYKKSPYYKKGIKNFLTTSDLKFLWIRDKAFFMKKPSINRKDDGKDYTLDNCEFIEFLENSKRGWTPQSKSVSQYSLKGKHLRDFESMGIASKYMKYWNKKSGGALIGWAIRKGKNLWGYNWRLTTPQSKKELRK